MTPGTHRKQLILFFAAVLLPCLVLVVLTLRLASQQRELSQKREIEDREKAVRWAREQLLKNLESIKTRGLDDLAADKQGRWSRKPGEPSLVLIAPFDGNRLLLPWDAGRVSVKSRQSGIELRFERKIQAGIRAELAEKDPARAAVLYRQALQMTTIPVQSARARLLLARALHKSGRRKEAIALQHKIFLLPFNLRDDQGIPFALYAATVLEESGNLDPAALEHIRSEVETRHWLPPPETYMLRNLCDAFVKRTEKRSTRASWERLHREAVRRVNLTERVLALRDNLPDLIPLRPEPPPRGQVEPLWVTYGPEPWLLATAEPAGGLPRTLVVIHSLDVFKSLQEGRADSRISSFRAKIVAGNQGEALGTALPGLRVQLTPIGDSGSNRSGALEESLYILTLVLVLSFTFFGAYLVWRDVRRELRLATLRSQFVSSVSHELRTPLAAIRMFAETLRMGRATDPTAEAEYLDTIVNESERLTRLLDNVLDFSKIERGERNYRRVPAPLPEVVRAAARTLQYPLANQGFNLKVEIEGDLPLIPVDTDAIEQAILNLLANAMKYSPHSRQIDLKLMQRNGDAVIQVKDHGIGIPPGEQARIFQKFYRVASPENRQIPGTGLGLTLVEHIAKAHGGRVEVESLPNQGSLFSIVLPLEERS